MCLRGVERRHEVENSGVAMMINEIEINFRIGKMWGGVNKCERSVAFSDPLSKRGALIKRGALMREWHVLTACMEVLAAKTKSCNNHPSFLLVVYTPSSSCHQVFICALLSGFCTLYIHGAHLAGLKAFNTQ